MVDITYDITRQLYKVMYWIYKNISKSWDYKKIVESYIRYKSH